MIINSKTNSLASNGGFTMTKSNEQIRYIVNKMYYNGMISWCFNNRDILCLAGGTDTKQSITELENLISQFFIPNHVSIEGTMYWFRGRNDCGNISVRHNKVTLDKYCA